MSSMKLGLKSKPYEHGKDQSKPAYYVEIELAKQETSQA